MTQTLSLQEKQRLIDGYSRRKNTDKHATKADPAAWAKDVCRVDQNPNKSTMSRIVKNRRRIQSSAKHRPLNDKRNRTGASSCLYIALYKWISNQNNRGVLLSGSVVRMYAEKLIKEDAKHLSGDKKPPLSFSQRSVDRFKKRYGLTF